MKILHTADWHLGKKLDHYTRIEEQIEVLDEMVSIAEEHAVDIVLIAGDLFDTFHPSTEAVDLFYKTLKRLTKNGKRPVIAIAGNHDSPSFIDAPDPLARECGIFLIGYPQAKVLPITLEDFKITRSEVGFIELKLHSYDYPFRLIHTPYANELRLKQYFGEEKEKALNEVLASHWGQLAHDFCDSNGVNVLMTHLYMNSRGAALLDEPEGEKPLKIGNADLVFADAIPQAIQYTALGHLHAYNNIGSDEKPVVYSSSILPYSFSEAGQEKFVNIVELEPNQPISQTAIRLRSGKKLARKSFTKIEDAVNWLSSNPDVLVELTIESSTYLTAEERKMLYQNHDGIVYLIPKVQNDIIAPNVTQTFNLDQDIRDLFRDYFKSKHQQEPNSELMQLFDEINRLD